jgi:hypothetical protein
MQVEQVLEKRQADDVYDILAALSGGQVLNLGTSDLSDLGELVSFSANQAQTTILRETGSVAPYIFYVDRSTQQVIISINGYGYEISVISPTGVDATSLDQFSVSLQSSSSFIATLNITSKSLLGEWQISPLLDNYYDVVVYAISDLSFSSDLFAVDPFSTYGFSAVVGKPLNGQPLIAAFQANDRSSSITIESVNLVDSSGAVLQTFRDILTLGDNAFATHFTPPPVLFYWQILGKDEEGYIFSRISDTAIEVSDIDLALGEEETGYYVLRPGNNIAVPILLFNAGYEAYFAISISQRTSGNVSQDIITFSESQILVGENSTNEFSVHISVSENATNGQTWSFTVVASSILDDSNDFVVFQLAVTTRPLPKVTENVYGVVPSSTAELCDSSNVLLSLTLVSLMGSIYMV